MGAPGPVWTGAENLVLTGIRSSDRPARSESLSRPTEVQWQVQKNEDALFVTKKRILYVYRSWHKNAPNRDSPINRKFGYAHAFR